MMYIPRLICMLDVCVAEADGQGHMAEAVSGEKLVHDALYLSLPN